MVIDRRDVLEKAVHDLPNGWVWEWFTDVMDVDGGTQPPASEFVDEPRPGYVRLVQIRDFESDAYITYIPDSPKWRKCNASDVLIARYGASLGRVCTGLEGAYNVALAKIVPSARIHLPFAYYLLRSSYFQGPLLAGGGRSAQAGFNKDGLSVIPLPIPPISVQHAIAKILRTLDGKIELNRRIAEILEAMARALFRSWFSDFDPVRAKSDGSAVIVPARIAKLFPDRLDDSEMGRIPAGWALGRLTDVLEQVRVHENPLTSPDALFTHYSIPAFDEGLGPKLETGGKIKSTKLRVPSDVVLLSKLNPEIERVWLVDVKEGEHAVCSTEFMVLRALPPFTTSYVYCLIRSPILRQHLEALVTGTSNSHQRAQADSVLALQVVLPPYSIVKAFDAAASHLLRRALACRRESHTLRGVRDTLLPRLISGELAVNTGAVTVQADV
jgi:type I restriction enzyme S subunit